MRRISAFALAAFMLLATVAADSAGVRGSYTAASGDGPAEPVRRARTPRLSRRRRRRAAAARRARLDAELSERRRQALYALDDSNSMRPTLRQFFASPTERRHLFYNNSSNFNARRQPALMMRHKPPINTNAPGGPRRDANNAVNSNSSQKKPPFR